MNRARVEVEARPQTTASAPAQTSIGTVAGQVLAANTDRRSVIIQNTGTTTIKLTLGSTAPTQTVYHVALKACGIADDGSGGIYADDAWRGAIQGISSGAGGTMVITEITF